MTHIHQIVQLWLQSDHQKTRKSSWIRKTKAEKIWVSRLIDFLACLWKGLDILCSQKLKWMTNLLGGGRNQNSSLDHQGALLAHRISLLDGDTAFFLFFQECVMMWEKDCSNKIPVLFFSGDSVKYHIFAKITKIMRWKRV